MTLDDLLQQIEKDQYGISDYKVEKLVKIIKIMRGLLGAIAEINYDYRADVQRCIKDCERIVNE